MSRFLRWMIGGLAVLVTVFVIVLTGGAIWLRGSLPQTEGALSVDGLRQPVEVLRDGNGIPTIRANSDHDAYFALGFVHAQDRLWQMDFMRRTGAGRLSEVAGSATVRLDRFMRLLGLYRVAEANYRNLSGPARDALDAYTAGVNAFLAQRDGPLPLEFELMRHKPEPWRPADSVVWGRLMALQLSENWNNEALRARLSQRLTPEQIAQLWPSYPADAPIVLGQEDRASGHDTGDDRSHSLDRASLELLDAVQAEVSSLLPWRLAPKSASNSWVLDGRHTESGKPILANDPHLALTAPGVWYLARIETPNWMVAGATAPGVPYLVAGHNGHVAWGLTTTHSDTQDLFIERLLEPEADGAPNRYETPSGPSPMNVREETIRVRWADAEVVRVRDTARGPLISDILQGAGQFLDTGSALSLAWPALDALDRTAHGLFDMNRARSAEAFKQAALGLHSPHQNIVFADTAGSIGFVAPAKVPIRQQGNGLFPAPGWNGDHDWIGMVPAEQLPAALNPTTGRFIAANNKTVPRGSPVLLTNDWLEHHRASRIVQMLDAAEKISLEQTQVMQLDDLSPGAVELLPTLLAAPTDGPRTAQAVDLMRRWDGRMTVAAPQPLIFKAWLRALNETVMADELGALFANFQYGNAARLQALLRDHPIWCDDVTTPEKEACDSRIAVALERALELLTDRFGNDMTDWRWGDAHIVRFEHPLLDRIPLLGALFDFAVAAPGGNDTVNRAGARFNGPTDRLFEDIHGPGLRTVYDLSDLDNSRFMIATGQSGNPLSPHYGGLAERWRDGNYLKLVAPAPAEAQRLVLTPQ